MRLPLKLCVTIVGAALLAVSAGALGNTVPPPWSGYVPMLVDDDFARDELVRINVGLDQPCVAFLGDSRTGFNVRAALVDEALPAGCRSQNFGFPSIQLDDIARFASDLATNGRVKTIVVTLSETMLTRCPEPEWLFVDWGRKFEPALRRWLFHPGWLRSMYLGHHRLANYLRSRLNMTVPLDSGWRWSASRKQWSFGAETRELVNLPSYASEVAAMVRSYYVVNEPRPDAEERLRKTLVEVASHAERLIVILPPSDASFRQRAEEVVPGRKALLARITRDVAQRLGSVIDCSDSACGITPDGFADPVHLNERGAAAYSRFLASRVAEVAPSR